MTELDLQAMGIWRITMGRAGESPAARVNVWAIEDELFGITLFDCGSGTSDSLVALEDGLAVAGATTRDVRRIIVSHPHPEHAGGMKQLVENSYFPVEVMASGPDLDRLPLPPRRKHELRDGERITFRRFVAVALRCPGHTPALTCLFAPGPALLFSSDHLVDQVTESACLVGRGLEPELDVMAYCASLTRLSRLEISVVLPGRGPPFAGHRRAIRDSLSGLVPGPRHGLIENTVGERSISSPRSTAPARAEKRVSAEVGAEAKARRTQAVASTELGPQSVAALAR